MITNETKTPIKRTVYICTNKRIGIHPKPSCGSKGSADMIIKMNNLLQVAGIENVQVEPSQCMGLCEYGCMVAVFPDNIKYHHVTIKDLDEIIKSFLINGNLIKRLVFE